MSAIMAERKCDIRKFLQRKGTQKLLFCLATKRYKPWVMRRYEIHSKQQYNVTTNVVLRQQHRMPVITIMVRNQATNGRDSEQLAWIQNRVRQRPTSASESRLLRKRKFELCHTTHSKKATTIIWSVPCKRARARYTLTECENWT